ncbi:hypothetical protein GGQ84_000745 [Desulfitispora alkaliphila]|uniref:SIMPL domain-containing protein n=1 Tax=Desulfitispora alkaliphila TaxID=622674 RepID=UPI003D1DD5C4
MQKKLMLSLLGVLIIFSAGWGLLSQGNSEAIAASTNQDRLIRVTGEAEVSVEPDRAQVVLGVETSNETAETATKENAQLTEELVNALKEFGLEGDQIKTSGYRVHSYREPIGGGRENPEYKNVYKAINELQMTVDKLDEVGKVIDVAIKNGANQVNSVQFIVNDTEAVKMQALQKATLQAKAKAEAIAGAADINIKGIKTITEEGGSYSPYRADYMREMAAEAKAVSTPIIPGDVEVRARVLVEYYF